MRNELRTFFATPERVAMHLENADQNLSEKQSLLEAHQRELQKVRDDMTRTHKLYLEGHITAQGFGQFYKPAEERLNQLVSELPKLEAEVDLLKVDQLSVDDVVHEANSLYDNWPTFSADDKRRIAESLFHKIIIGDEKIAITFANNHTSEEVCKNQQRLRGPG